MGLNLRGDAAFGVSGDAFKSFVQQSFKSYTRECRQSKGHKRCAGSDLGSLPESFQLLLLGRDLVVDSGIFLDGDKGLQSETGRVNLDGGGLVSDFGVFPAC